MKRLLIAAAAAALAATAAQAQPAAEPAVVTRHSITVAGKPLAFTAEAGRIPIRDAETGAPHGWMFYTAYRVASAKPRPVTFVWNGGPGAASATLHFGVAGPKRAEGGALVDNAETWLTATDLVFVDPIGTGFSRPTKAEYAAEFYSTPGDVASVAEFVRAWRLTHGAEASPIYLVGESWGAGRAASVSYALEKRGMKVAGAVLISGGAGLRAGGTLGAGGEPSTVAALRVVAMASTAFYHHRLSPELGASLDAVQAAAERWARETYAPALARAASLSDAERDKVAADLSRFTGVPADKIDRNTLILPPRPFRSNLVAGKTLNTFDMRIVDEPREGARAAELRWFRHDLGYATDLPYVGLEALEDGFAPSGKYPDGVGARWDYATAQVTPEQRAAAIAEAQRTGAGPPNLGPPLPATAETVALDPKFRVLVASGLYDSFANCAGYDEMAKGLAPELKRAMTFRCYPGGHMMYRDAPNRVLVSHDLRAFVSGGQ